MLHVHRWVVATLFVVSVFLLPHGAAQATIGTGSCSTGTTPCDGSTGDVGDDSCNGDDACLSNSGFPTIGNESCNEVAACTFNSGAVGDDSCNGFLACDGNEGNIARWACNGPEACYNNSGKVWQKACQGESACRFNEGLISEKACVGPNACVGNTGDVHVKGCLGDSACLLNSGNIGKASCRGESACEDNSGNIGKNACQGERACFNNTLDRKKGECSGPPVNGVGVCEQLRFTFPMPACPIKATTVPPTKTDFRLPAGEPQGGAVSVAGTVQITDQTGSTILLLAVAAEADGTGVSFARTVKTLAHTTGQVTFDRGCTKTDPYGSNDCTWTWGESITAAFQGALQEDITSGKLIVDLKIDNTIPFSFNCPLCGADCTFTVPEQPDHGRWDKLWRLMIRLIRFPLALIKPPFPN